MAFPNSSEAGRSGHPKRSTHKGDGRISPAITETDASILVHCVLSDPRIPGLASPVEQISTGHLHAEAEWKKRHVHADGSGAAEGCLVKFSRIDGNAELVSGGFPISFETPRSDPLEHASPHALGPEGYGPE